MASVMPYMDIALQLNCKEDKTKMKITRARQATKQKRRNKYFAKDRNIENLKCKRKKLNAIGDVLAKLKSVYVRQKYVNETSVISKKGIVKYFML